MREEDFSFFQEEEFKKNLARYEDMISGGASAYLEADELTDIAEYYLTQNETEKANQCIEYALRLHPESVDPQIFNARQLMFAGKLHEAQEICNRISDQNDREVLFLHAELLIRMQRNKEAIGFLEARKEQFRDNADDLWLYLYDCACIFMDYMLVDTAKKWVLEAENISGPNMKLMCLLAEIHNIQEEYAKAAELLEKILDIDPYSVRSWNMLADTLFMDGKYDQAIEATEFSLAINDKENPDALFIKANSLYHLENFEKAHEIYSKFIEKYPQTDEFPYLFDGLCLNQMEQYEDACSRLEIAEKQANGFSTEQLQIYLQLSFTYSKTGRFQKAMHYLDRARELSPEEFDYYVLRGHILLENGFIAEANAAFQQAKDEGNDSERTYFLMAVSYFENRIYADALEIFHELIQFCEEKAKTNSYPYMAFCYYVAKDEVQYLKFLELSCKHNPEGTQMILGQLFPESLNPGEYYAYLIQKRNNPDFE